MIFVSLEFAFLLLVGAVGILLPSFWDFVGEHLQNQSNVMAYLPLATVALCSWAVKLAFNLTSPASGSNRHLYDWPDYWKLKLRRNLTIAYCLLCAGVALVMWVFHSQFSAFWVGLIGSTILCFAVITCGCALMAVFTLKETCELV